MRARRAWCVAAVVAVGALSCGVLLDLDGLGYRAGADADGAPPASGDAGAEGGRDPRATCETLRPGASDGALPPAAAVCDDGGLPTDLRTPVNCGACGHSCLTADCVDATCVPTTLPLVESSRYSGLQHVNGSMHFLRQHDRSEIEVDVVTDGGVQVLGTFTIPPAYTPFVYAAAIRPPALTLLVPGAMLRVDLGDPDAGARTLAPYNGVVTVGLASDDLRFYFVETDGRIYARDLVTGEEHPIARDQRARWTLLPNGGDLWWLNEGETGSIARYAGDGGTVQVVVDALWNPQGLAIDADFLYFTSARTDSIELRRVPRIGGASELLSTFQGSRRTWGLMTWHGSLLWLLSTADADAATPQEFDLYVVPLCGGAPRLTQRVGYATELAADGTYAYWSNGLAVFRGVP